MEIEQLIKEREFLKCPAIAKKYNLTVSQLRYKFKKHGVEPLQAGRPKIPFNEQLIEVVGRVKRKHYNEVQSLINELIQPYR